MTADTADHVIRVAASGELPQVLALMRGYYRDDGLEFDQARAASTMARLLEQPQWGFVLLVESGGEPVGYVAVCLGFSLELGGNDAYIDEMFVETAHRGRGHGRRLLDAAAAHARARGICAIHLEVDRNNTAARSLYASLGYRARDRYFLMTCDLEAPPP
jgi:ribosomal protein S18 acetylase RimI-like enzyme